MKESRSWIIFVNMANLLEKKFWADDFFLCVLIEIWPLAKICRRYHKKSVLTNNIILTDFWLIFERYSWLLKQVFSYANSIFQKGLFFCHTCLQICKVNVRDVYLLSHLLAIRSCFFRYRPTRWQGAKSSALSPGDPGEKGFGVQT